MNWVRRVLGSGVVLFGVMLFGLAPQAFGDPAGPAKGRTDATEIGVHILVLEAERSKDDQGIDPRLTKAGLAKDLTRLGYVRAKVLDELDTRVERGARVSLQMPSRKQNLQVKLLEAKPKKKQFRLELAVPEERFRMTTNHTGGGTVLIFLPPARSRPDIGFAVTPRP